MAWLLPGLVALTLISCGGVALLPELWGSAAPRLTPPSTAHPVAWLVEGEDGRWWLNGEPIRPAHLATALAALPWRQGVRYLPAMGLSMEHISASLRWLRQHSPAPVQLHTEGP